MKFLCTAVVLLAAASKTSASSFFELVSPSSLPEEEGSREGVMPLEEYQKLQRQEQEPGSQLPVGSSGSSYSSSSSSGSSMAPRPVPALSPKHVVLRENDLAAIEQAKKRQEGEVEGEEEEEEEQPGSIPSSSSSSSSSSMSSSTSSKQPSPYKPSYWKLVNAVRSNNARELTMLLPFASLNDKESALLHLTPSENSDLVFEVLMSMSDEGRSSELFKEYAQELLPHIQSWSKSKELVAAVRASTVSSSSSSSSSSMSSSTSSKQPSPDPSFYWKFTKALKSNDTEELRRLLSAASLKDKETALLRLDPSKNSDLMFEVLMSMSGEGLSPELFKEFAQELLPHLQSRQREELSAIIGA